MVAFLDRLYTAKRKAEERIVVLGGEDVSVCSITCTSIFSLGDTLIATSIVHKRSYPTFRHIFPGYSPKSEFVVIFHGVHGSSKSFPFGSVLADC